MKEYIIFAGVNGAGKSTLYQTNDNFKKFPRINMDEIVREFGSWKNPADIMKAGIIAVRRMKEYLSAGESFNQETTLCGKSVIGNIIKAKEQGYKIILYYVGVESIGIAQKRVHQRVQHGGHGIPDEDIARRYYESLERLNEILYLCDVIELYDNTIEFVRIARIHSGVCVERFGECPKWAELILKNCR